MFRKKNRSHRGFTLIELVIAIAIIAIMAAISVPNIVAYVEQSGATARNNDAHTIFLAMQNAFTEMVGSGTFGEVVPTGSVDLENQTVPAPASGSMELRLNKDNIAYLSIDKSTLLNASVRKETQLYKILSQYMPLGDVLESSILVEYNKVTGNVRAVFISGTANKLSYTSAVRAENVSDRTQEAVYDKKQGYYGIEFSGVPRELVEDEVQFAVNLINSDSESFELDCLAVEIIIPKEEFDAQGFDTKFDIKILSISGATYIDLKGVDPLRTGIMQSAAFALSPINSPARASDPYKPHSIYIDKFTGKNFYRLVLVLDAISSVDGEYNMRTGNSISYKYPAVKTGDYISAQVTAKSVSKNYQETLTTPYKNTHFADRAFPEATEINNKKSQIASKDYDISTMRQMSNIRYLLDGAFTQKNDIAASDWTASNPVSISPIGSLRGTYDGGGHRIIKLSVKSASGRIGMFSANAGTIRNVTLEDPIVAPEINTGTIAGFNSGLIENCHVIIETDLAVYEGESVIGGIAGRNEKLAAPVNNLLRTKTGGNNRAYSVSGQNYRFFTNATDAGRCPLTYANDDGCLYLSFAEMPGNNNKKNILLSCPTHTQHEIDFGYNMDAIDNKELQDYLLNIYQMFKVEGNGLAIVIGQSVTDADIAASDGLIPSIINCTSAFNMRGGYAAGGIAGINYYIIRDCSYFGFTVDGTQRDSNAGGIAGININALARANRSTAVITNCKSGVFPRIEDSLNALTSIQSTYENETLISCVNNSYAGGIVGLNDRGNVINCVNIAGVQSDGNSSVIGGLIGRHISYDGSNNGILSGSVNAGEVILSGGSGEVGGLAGRSEGLIQYCYNNGRVNVSRITNSSGTLVPAYVSSANSYTGGLCGHMLTPARLVSSYNTSYIKFGDPADRCGAIAGYVEGDIAGGIMNCASLMGKSSVQKPFGRIEAQDVPGAVMVSDVAQLRAMYTQGEASVWDQDTTPRRDRYYYPLPYGEETGHITPFQMITLETAAAVQGAIVNGERLELRWDSYDTSASVDIKVYNRAGGADTEIISLSGVSLSAFAAGTKSAPAEISGGYYGYRTGIRCFLILDDGSGLFPAGTLQGEGVIYATISSGGYTCVTPDANALFAELSSGTARIANLRHLVNLNYLDNFASVAEIRQIYDIDAKGAAMQPINLGAKGQSSDLIYNGAGKKIYNLNITASDAARAPGGAGLFSAVGSRMTIDRLSLVNVNVSNNTSASGMVIAGGFAGTNSGTISQCYIAGGTVSATGIAGETVYSLGGIAGMNGGTVINCHSQTALNITGTFEAGAQINAGGIAGANSGTVRYAYSTAAKANDPALNSRISYGALIGANNGTLEAAIYLNTLPAAAGAGAQGTNVSAMTGANMRTAAAAALLNGAQAAKPWAVSANNDFPLVQLSANVQRSTMEVAP